MLTSKVRAITRSPKVPLLLLGVVGVFLLLQHLVDRRDPKLALTLNPTGDLAFGPPMTDLPAPPRSRAESDQG